ncbi:F-box domain-containing protein [Cephalotus follicularis]|uniref:F-box domain-containing protein n=1 Tax=Cephalotus follicularis TaxID=3775 RepID=A0A1Q3ALL3_CEPFO|nr:F-box domain-containing protein [Cephalotus follicularis]
MMPRTLQKPSKPRAMDPLIWSRLPQELLELVLSFLPLKTFLNLRSTCKHFKSLIFSPFFMSKHLSSSSSFSSFILLSHPQCYHHFPIYETTVGSWRYMLPRAALSSTLLSISNGLLCFSLHNSSSFLVCNLLSKSSRKIKFPNHPIAFDSLTLVSTPYGYHIFMLCSKFSFVYDSRVHSWQKYDALEPFLCGNHQEGVLFNRCLYFTTPEPFSLVSFDLERGKWERSNAELPNELTFVRLVSDGEGRLYLIGGIGRNGISRSLKLWELGDTGSWIEVETLPDMICRKFMSVCYHNYEHVYCFWHQGMVCVCCYTWPEVLYYKVPRRTWHWLPKCPSLPDKWSCGFRWFSFVPELYALV